MKKTLLFLLIFILAIFAGLLLSSLVTVVLGEIADSALAQFIMYCSIFITTIVVMALFARRMGWVMPTPAPRFGKLDFSLILLSFLIIEAFSIVLEPLADMMPSESLDKLYDYMQGGLWAIATAVIAAPVLEEFLFRGIVQQNLVRFVRYPLLGIFISSLIFGLIHIVPQQVLFATLLGFVIGVVYYLSKSLMTVVLIHFVNNGVAYLFFLFLGKDFSYREAAGSSYYAIYGICAVFIVVMLTIGIVRVVKVSKSDAANQRIANTAE